MSAQLLPIADESPLVIYMYQIYRYPHPLPPNDAVTNFTSDSNADYYWGECGCTPPYDEAAYPDAYCYYGSAPHTTHYGSAFRNTLLNTVYDDLDDEWDPTTEAYVEYAKNFTQRHVNGTWGPNDIFWDDVLETHAFYLTYYLPLKWSTTGVATDIIGVDIGLQYMMSAAASLRLPGDAELAIIEARRDQLSATSYPIELYNVPNTSRPQEKSIWMTENVPSEDLRAVIRVTKDRLGAAGWLGLDDTLTIMDWSDKLIGVQPVRVGDLRLVVLMVIDRDYYFGDGIRVRNMAIIIGVVGFVVIAAAAAVLSLWVARPLSSMGRDMQDAARLECDVQRLEKKELSAVAEVARLQRAFLRMNYYLASAKPFLPQYLFDGMGACATEDESECDGRPRRLPPGIGEATSPSSSSVKPEPLVAIVFTDIVGSSSMWEAIPDDMGQALRLHNKIIRAALLLHDGYEIKTIGDSFMIAFDGPSDALAFALTAQRDLLAADWSDAVLQLAPRDTKGLWGGLTVRIGVQAGPVSVEQNQITGLYDYFGSTANLAARLEGVCPRGGICMSAELLGKVRKDEKDGGPSISLSPFISSAMGPKELRGFADPIDVVAVWPTALADRSLKPDRSEPTTVPERPIPRLAQQHRQVAALRKALYKVASASVASVLIAGDSDVLAQATASSVARVLEVALQNVRGALERTHGSVVNVSGASVTVSWNAGSSCANHLRESLRFVGLVFQRPQRVCVGLSNGACLQGSVGTTALRFVTVIGACMRVAQVLMDAAAAEGLDCLAASAAFGPCRYSALAVEMPSLFTPHGRWELRPRPKEDPAQWAASSQLAATNPLLAHRTVASNGSVHSMSDADSVADSASFGSIRSVDPVEPFAVSVYEVCVSSIPVKGSFAAPQKSRHGTVQRHSDGVEIPVTRAVAFL
eukprot:TRINITY_DN20399_c0_g1_i1.p1 TRINITY_DN20399_c0_g1~~TRINITY_DN20399_c0_g1_i1.p1  ORF type:complete len:1028 (+),score=184.93 TRINITY_DN20399_c0_g1_i1:321-3086(+)